MFINSNTVKFTILFFLLLFLVAVANVANATSLGSNFFSQKTESVVSLPVRISPILVEAPPRHIDLLPVRAKNGVLTHSGLGTDIVSHPLTGLQVNLNEFPVLKLLISANREAAIYGLELELDTRDKGIVDTLVRIGNPTLFPDMLKESINFNSAEFMAKDFTYKIKRVLGLAVDGKWRYTAVNNKLDRITKGVVSASFEQGSALLLQRTFAASSDLSKTPWLHYEYELTEGLPWVVQVTAKIDHGLFNPKMTILSSEPVRGGGKQKLLVNLLDLLNKAEHDAKDGRLVELFIRFALDEGLVLASQNVRIDLGKLDFYHAQMLAEANGAEALLVTNQVGGANINLLKALDKRLSSTNTPTVLGGRLVRTKQDFTTEAEGFPKINLLTEYREMIPELFVGDRFFLDELSSADLNSVLDQKIFYKKRFLWESGQSDVIFRNLDGPLLPLLSFTPNTLVNGDSYFKANFLFEDGEQHPLRITLSGIGIHGKSVTKDYRILSNIPIRLENIRFLKKATLSFWQEDGAKIPFPASFLIRNIQLISFDKTASYSPNLALAYAALVPAEMPFWRAKPERFDVDVSDTDGIQILNTFPVETNILGNAIIKYEIKSSIGENVSTYMRVRAIDRGRYLEKVIPMDGRGEVPISNLYLRSLEIFAKPNSQQASLVNFLLLKKFELAYKSAEATSQNKFLQPKYIGRNEVTYLAPHKPFDDPTLAWLRPAYEVVEPKYDLAAMHKLNATLSYSQILGGGKIAVLPETVLTKGNNNLNYLADEGVSVLIDPSFLKLKDDQLAGESKINDAGKPVFSKVAKLGFLVLALTIVWFGVKTIPRWMPLLDRFLCWWPAFLLVQFLLFNAALYMIFFSANKDAISWGGLFLTFAYGLAVNYKIRSFLIKKSSFFSEQLSAPYFLLFFALLILCAVMVMLKFNTAAENIAVMGYYLLVTGVVIEFFVFAKEAQLDAALSTKKSEYSKI